MKTSSITPVDRARRFDVGDLFFSTTDRKGVITACNDVFVRIAGFAPDELLGEPHNVIRHPDMPRCVFQLLWSEILEGRPIGAYVKNMAQTGEYYWVFALVLPIPEGFLSIRLKPTSPLLEKVKSAYAALLAEEAQYGRDWRAGMAASAATLPAFLSSLGCASYGELMAHALHAEIEARQEALEPVARDPLAEQITAGVTAMRAARDELAGGSAMSDMGFDVSLLALNASVIAAKQGRRGQALTIIGRQISEVARELLAEARNVDAAGTAAAQALHDTAFRLSAFALVREMERFFAESRDDLSIEDQERTCGATFDVLGRTLAAVNEQSVERCRQNFEALDANLASLQRTHAALGRTAIHLDLGQITGKTICAELPRGQAFARLLGEVSTLSSQLRDQLVHQQESMRSVADLVARWRRSGLMGPARDGGLRV